MHRTLRSLIPALAAASVLIGAEQSRLAIQVVDAATVSAGLGTPWWTTDGPTTPVLIPAGSPPLPIPDPTGVVCREEFERFLNGSTLNPHRAAALLLGAPTRREPVVDGGILLWDRVVLSDRRGIGFHARLEVTANGAQCAWAYTAAPVLR